jgi:hypothetical protein
MNEERRKDCDDKRNIYDHLLRVHYRASVATGVEQTKEVVHHIAYAYYVWRWLLDENLIITKSLTGPSWTWSYDSWIYNYLCNQWLSPLMLWVRISIRARCTTLCDKVCQWLATGTPVSSTSKTDCHDTTKMLLKVALNNHNFNPNTKPLNYKLIWFQIIQRRYNGSLSFERDWQTYKEGFGYPNGEYWLGMYVVTLAFIKI